MNVVKEEIKIFLTAVMFYTRIPCPKWVDHSKKYINLSVRYVPLIGAIVGGFSWLVFYLSHFVLDSVISVLLSIIASIFLTGAFHEDGFADVCDGFGGGWTKEKILMIMKDSRVGVYGVVGLIMILTLKFSTLLQLSEIPFARFALILISSHSLSRLSAVSIIFFSNYVRKNEIGKANSVAEQKGIGNFTVAIVIALVPFGFLLASYFLFVILLFFLSVVTLYMNWYFKKWIGGYTGDCLGATQQVNEVIFYLGSLIICNFI